MKSSWYICCDACGAQVFVSRWRWCAALVMGTIHRRMKAGLVDCWYGAPPPELRYISDTRGKQEETDALDTQK